ncbi:MAG: hypothetical protein WC468_02000 [Candidatus Paceibacterota bacterium]
MRNDRHLATSLRKRGKSYKEISDELGVPKSTLNAWFKDSVWSEKIKNRLTEKAVRTSEKRIRKVIDSNRERWEKLREGFREDAKKEFPRIREGNLFVAGVMLYWGEGDQNPKYPVRLTNVDYRMIALFRSFLLDVCKVEVDDIYLSLFIYPDLKEDECKKFWKKKTKIWHFDKTQVIYGKHPTKRLENGICSIRVKKSAWLKEKILVWISLLSEELNNKARV